MSTTGRPDGTAPAASDIATRLRDAGLVRLVAAATGDAVAATGLVTRALESHGVAHQSSVVSLPDSAQRATDADLTVALGRPTADADIELGIEGTPASTTALSVTTELGAVDYELALAGIIAAGTSPTSDVLGAASERGIDRRPGIAAPTSDLADALAHSSLVHAPFSGDVEDATGALTNVDVARDETDEEGNRRLASTVALAVCADDRSTPRAAEAVERFLRPLATPGGRFETVEGYADVLDATARERPGLAVALALGANQSEAALETWRTHTRRAHEAVRSASTGRYDGLYVVSCDGNQPLGTVARLVADYRSPEPLVLAVDDSEAVAVVIESSSDHLGLRIDEAAETVGGRGDGTATLGHARFDGDPTEFVVAFREAQ